MMERTIKLRDPPKVEILCQKERWQLNKVNLTEFFLHIPPFHALRATETG